MGIAEALFLVVTNDESSHFSLKDLKLYHRSYCIKAYVDLVVPFKENRILFEGCWILLM